MMNGGKPIVINQNLNFSTGVSQTVRAEVMNMLPQIQSSTLEAMGRLESQEIKKQQKKIEEMTEEDFKKAFPNL